MTNKTGTLYLCATPIGNLEDMTYRVVRTLNEVDVIAAEDTRNSIKLLNHFDIHTPMTSNHEYNKIEKGRILVRQMLEGQNVALITDAGMPGISDPGEELVRMCRDAGVPVTALPGACACVTALVISGFFLIFVSWLIRSITDSPSSFGIMISSSIMSGPLSRIS